MGFAEDNSWRFNPSYLPPTLRSISPALARRGLRCAKPINVIAGNRPERLFARLGALWERQGWQLKAEKTLISSYDAIRVTCG